MARIPTPTPQSTSIVIAGCIGRGHVNAGLHCYECLKKLYALADAEGTTVNVQGAIGLGATAISNLSLGLEIFLKMHHFQTTGTYPNGHDIGVLVETFPKDVQSYLSSIYTEMLENKMVQDSPTLTINVGPERLKPLDSWPTEAKDLHTAAKLLGKAYVRWRYIYEELHSPFLGTISFKPLLSMVYTLDFAILNFRSEAIVSVDTGDN